jgi:hypothetical protein
MTARTIARSAVRKSLALLSCFLLVAAGSPASRAQSEAAIAGVILDPAGNPAPGFKVVLRDVGSNQEFTSGPADAQGNYSAQVPVGGRYKLESVIADDGVTNLPVQDVPPVSVLGAGTTRMNVRFVHAAGAGAAPAAAPAAAAAAAPAGEEKKDKKKGGVPWYKRPGPIVGMVLGGAALLALALGGGGSSSNNNASPSAP